MTNIAVLSGNNLYRIGDCIFWDQNLYKQILANADKFRNTFLYAFSTRLNDEVNSGLSFINKNKPFLLNHDTRIRIAVDVVTTFIKTRRFKIPPPNALVVHLRLGDSLDGTESTKYHLQPQDYILDKISKYNGNKIIIVTAYHNHSNDTTIITNNNNKSQEFLDTLISKIPQKYSVSIRSSSNIDADFIYLCAATNLLITGAGSFAIAAKDIGRHIHIK